MEEIENLTGEQLQVETIKEAEIAIFDSVVDTGIDIAELGIDLLCDSEIIKDIPILGTVFKLGKAGYSISRRMYIKKILTFVQEMQKKQLYTEKMQEHKNLLLSNPKRYNEELETIVEYLNRQVGYEKSKFYARVYLQYLNEEIDYEVFTVLFEIIDQLFFSDLGVFKVIYEKDVLKEEEHYKMISCKRLSNCGLIDFFNGMTVKDPDSENKIFAKLSDIGKYFAENVCMYKKEIG